MDRLGAKGKVSKARVHLEIWTMFLIVAFDLFDLFSITVPRSSLGTVQ